MAGLTERERDLKTRRAEVWEAQKPLIEKYTLTPQDVTVEERKAYHDREAELQGLDEELRDVLSMQTRLSEEREAADVRGVSTDQAEADADRAERAFTDYLRYGDQASTVREAAARGELRAQAQGEAIETRLNPLSTLPVAPAAGSTLAGEGGYLVPQGFWHNLQIAMKAYGGSAPHFRQVRTESGNPMPWPTMDPTGIVGSLLSENTQVTEVDFSFGQGMLSAWTYTSGLHLASIQIVNDAAFDVGAFVVQRVGEAIGRAQAAAAISGTGSSQPLGITTAINARGSGSVGNGGFYALSAAHPVNTIGSGTATTELVAGALAFDTVLKMITYVDPAYRSNAIWVMNDTTLQQQRSVASTTGFPLWQPNVQVGGTEADRIYGYPVQIDQNVASLTASTIGGPIFGSLDHAMVLRTVDQAGIMRLTERYADFLQVGWIGYVRFDIRSNDLRAVVQSKAAGT